VLGAVCLVLVAVPRWAAGEGIEAALEQARRESGLVILVLEVGEGPETSWVEEASRFEAARPSLPHVLVVLPAARHGATAARFSASELPQTLLLDPDGGVLGRLLGRQTPSRWARQLLAMLRVAHQARAALERPAESLDIETLLAVGMYRWNRGEKGPAASIFELVRQRGRDSAARGRDASLEAEQHLAQYHLDLGRFAEAEALARASLSALPAGEPRCRPTLLLAMSLRGQGRTGQAAELLQSASRELRSAPGCDELLFTLGYLQLELGDQPAAQRSFRACAEGFPQTLHGQRAARRCGPTVEGASP
jgi:tetratricopeptide (TPR) repeat protein